MMMILIMRTIIHLLMMIQLRWYHVVVVEEEEVAGLLSLVVDVVEADAIFTMLMGEKVAPRKSFIMSEARKVQNLDI